LDWRQVLVVIGLVQVFVWTPITQWAVALLESFARRTSGIEAKLELALQEIGKGKVVGWLG